MSNPHSLHIYHTYATLSGLPSHFPSRHQMLQKPSSRPAPILCNAIQMLGNFPLSPRLQTLLCAQNRISRISESASKSVPNLHTLVLTQNNLSELSDLVPLRGFGKLTYVSLVENPVASKEVSAIIQEKKEKWILIWKCVELPLLAHMELSTNPVPRFCQGEGC